MKQIECRTLADRRCTSSEVAFVDRRSNPDRRSTQGEEKATQLIARISAESKKTVMGESLACYLMRHDLLGVLWSPKHLACIFYRFEHHTGIRQSVAGASRLFNTLHRIALNDYKTLMFDGIDIKDRAQFLSHLDVKIAAKYGTHFQAHVNIHGLTADADHSEFVEREWHYLQARRGTGISI